MKVKSAECATEPTSSIAWRGPKLAPLAAVIVTVTVVEAPGASVTLVGDTEKSTPEPELPVVESAQVAGAPPMFRIRTDATIDWPLMEGTAPKLTLTGLRAAEALAAALRSSRPAPAMFTLFSGTSVRVAAVGARCRTLR